MYAVLWPSVLPAGEKNFIGIGVCNETYPTHILPGWRETSIALHTDNGSIFDPPHDPEPLGFSCRRGCVVKCNLAPDPLDSASVVVEFYKDGERVKAIPTRLPEGGFYGIVGMMSRGERIQVSPPMITHRLEFSRVWEVCCPHAIQHHRDGLCSYIGPGYSDDDSIGTVRTKQRIDPFGPLSSRCFEIRIVNPGEKMYIAIGICSQEYPQNMLPGWKDTSVGYHADNGNLFHNCDNGEPTGHPCRKGDTMRCTVQPMDGSQKQVLVVFHHNGQVVGKRTVWTPENGFYGSFGMMSKEECVQVSLPEVSEPYTIPKASFLSVWEAITPNLQYQENGIFAYTGEGGPDSVGSVRSKAPINPLSPNNTFEMKIVDPGERCYIALGVCSPQYPATELPGWTENSVGFHADNGLILNGEGDEQMETRCNCVRGDVIRCTVEPVDGSNKQVNVVFHRNAVLIGKVMLWNSKGGFHAQIGSMSKGEVIQVASPQTVPSSLMHDAPARSMSVPAAQMPKEAMKRKQASTLTHATKGGSAGSFGDHRFNCPLTAPVLQPTVHSHHPHGVASTQLMSAQPDTRPSDAVTSHHPEHQARQLDHQQHQPQRSVSPPATKHIAHAPKSGNEEQHKTDSPHPASILQTSHHPHGVDPTQLISAPTHAPMGGHEESFSDNRFHRPLTAPVSEPTVHPQHPRGGASTQLVSAQPNGRPSGVVTSHHHPEHQARHLDHQHQPQRSVSPPVTHTAKHTDRNFPHPPLVPYEHAETASPAPFQPADGHPLEKQGAKLAGQYVHPLDVKQGPPYASQASVASAASDSDIQYWSPIATEILTDKRSRAASGSYVRSTEPSERVRRYRTQGQPIPTQKPMHHDSTSSTPVKPLVPNTEPDHDLKTSPKGGFHTDTSLENVGKKGIDFPDSPILPRHGQSMASQHFPPVHTKTEAVHEPVKGVDCLAPPVHFFTKKENSLCRILHNASCGENGTLRCVPPSESPESSFVMRHLQLTEKMPYFEVELVEYENTSSVIVGLVPQDHSYAIPMGSLPCTIAYNTAAGSLLSCGEEKTSVTKACSVGDVIGCRVEWTYKLEACDPNKESFVKVEWFRNGCSIAVKSINVPSSGLYPAIGMTGVGTTVKFRHSIGLKPDSFFDSHPLPENFTNIEVPLSTADGWNCVQNAQIDENCFATFQDDHSSLPTIVQSQTPFTTVQPYFEVELQYPISSYSILSVGALERVSTAEQAIPGEAPNSIGLFPLLDFVMRNGSISTTLPQTVQAEMKTSSEKLRVGVGVDFHQSIATCMYSSTATRRVKIFFTINSQLINSTYTTIPSTGLCPTVAVGSDFRNKGDKLAKFQFSHLRPHVSTLPLGFARAPHNSFRTMTSRTVAAENSVCEGSNTPRSLQAALPLSLSHTYFEIRIMQCQESHVFSCGVTPYNSSLTCHPGTSQDSIGFYPSEGSVHHNDQSSVVCPPCSYKGATIGCGARFPSDGSSKYMEVFFTVNNVMVVRRIVAVPEPGLYPTVGFYTQGKGAVSVTLFAEDPFPDLQFSTTWRELRNMKAEGAILQTTSPEFCMAQLVHSVSLNKPAYFTVSLLADIDPGTSITIGFSNSTTYPPLEMHPKEGDSTKQENTVLLQDGWMGCFVNASTGQALVEDKVCNVEMQQSHQYGCGIEPIKNSSNHLFFFTGNNQVVFCREFRLTGDAMFPTIFVSGPTARVHVDACALWPLQSAIGAGWVRVRHLVLENSAIRHVATDQRAKIPVGFAQASMPMIPSLSYFEVEVCSRSVDKAIAIGLASRIYPGNTWVGWKSNSIAYHLDDGNLFTGSGMFSHKIGPKIFQGHVVGCGVVAKQSDSETKEGRKVEVFFTVNGAVIVEQKIAVPIGGFYPTICLESPTESLIFHRYPHFPPVQNLLGSDWGNCYSMHRAGMVLEHSCKHRELPPKGIPRGFCQASLPFSPDRSYFEIKVVGYTYASLIIVGAAVQIPLGCRSPSADSVMYSCTGSVQVRSGHHKSTTGTQRYGIGDVVGCALTFTNDQPTAAEFYLNKMKLVTKPLLEKWRGMSLFPTILLSHPGNALLPELNLSPPEWDHSSLIGWLRTERVRVRGDIAEYHPSNSDKNEVGLCQINQCLENASFEVEILDRGKDCLIGVGVASTSYPATDQPGWSEDSVAYHGDDGFLFSNDPYGISFGPTWNDRDVIGVGVRPPKFESTEERETQVYFTKNGLDLGHTTIPIPSSGLFPTVGFHSPGAKVKITVNPSSTGLGNFSAALLQWREILGMQLQSTSHDKECVLQYHDNGRKMPRSGTKLALAIYGEPFSEKLHYFELDLLSMGTYTSISIGVVPKKYPLDNPPGWGKGSLAYQTDNGQLYQARDRGKYFGPIAKKGDTIGCGINFTPNNRRQCSVYFTYNGVEIGRVRSSIPPSGLYPSLSLTQKHDKVRVRVSETFKPKILIPELHMVGLMRISNCSYSDQIVQFTGGSVQGSTPGFAQFAVPMHKDRNYFVAHILKADDTITIGLAVKDYPMRYPPGSTSISMAYDITKGSIRAVYDGDNFHRFDACELKCTVGDRVGCGVVTSASKSEPTFVYFTRNGCVMKKIQFAELFEDLYPVVGFEPVQRSSLLFMDWNMPLFESPNLLFDC